jgi:hypothetical protein
MDDQYKQIMNYVFLLKDASDFNKPGTIINEVITSRHDSCRIGEMLHLLKHNYQKLFDISLSFRLVVLDLSWASIHAALETLNMESVEEYSHRMLNCSIQKSDVAVSFRVKSFLSSCVSHRFTRGLKKHVKFFNNECKTFAVCCFSLLVNCTDLESSKRIFSQ